MISDEVDIKANNLLTTFPLDLEKQFFDELLHFRAYIA